MPIKCNLKYFITVFIVLSLILWLAVLGCDTKKEKYEPKYYVTIGNWFSCGYYSCEYYIYNNNTYKLFNTDSLLINEFTISDGYYVKIRLNQKRKVKLTIL